MIDRDEDGVSITAFWTEALPCESCGEPTYQTRQWNAEYELWIAVDCSCSVPVPEMPVCDRQRQIVETAQTVGELLDRIKEHRQTCPVCGPVPIRPAWTESEAA